MVRYRIPNVINYLPVHNRTRLIELIHRYIKSITVDIMILNEFRTLVELKRVSPPLLLWRESTPLLMWRESPPLLLWRPSEAPSHNPQHLRRHPPTTPSEAPSHNTFGDTLPQRLRKHPPTYECMHTMNACMLACVYAS